MKKEKEKASTPADTGADADEFLQWVRNNWDPISIAKAAVSLEIKPIAIG